jgi:CRP-like cAMP-binding protein
MLDQLPNTLLQQRKTVQLEANQPLFIQGTKPKFLYFLEEGEVQLTRCGQQGETCTLQRIQRGFLAEASLFAKYYHCDAYCSKKSQLSAFPIQAFRQQLGQDGFYEVWIQLLSKEIKRLRNQCQRLALNSASDRILHYLQTEGQNGELTPQSSKKEWAAELGLSHETLYRTLHTLQKQKQLEIVKQKTATQFKLTMHSTT